MDVAGCGIETENDLVFRIRLKRTGSLCVDSFINDDTECSEPKSISSSLVVNPWIFKVHQEGLKRHLRSSNKVVKSKFFRCD